MNHSFEAVPEGLAMALAQNIYAMHHFSSLSEQARMDVIAQARQTQTQEEMRSLVENLIPH